MKSLSVCGMFLGTADCPPEKRNLDRINHSYALFQRTTVKLSWFGVVICEIHQVISLELPNGTSISVFLTYIPDKGIKRVFSKAIVFGDCKAKLLSLF